ncbi:hypothetical protein DDB_G0285633 [Dictyostelium discoideum AX4]|uniref:Uncharacterized protein n=1 Tax=Dictyostelium discoideum TaxID=44689 RepID=Q54MW4_DICDI|nr:hypothetical protein DDB_G0285633 [Dictyostelium discoideum AX4]EAL64654.1 hypothetical protein DDB_G0285633 [Dictyostelium discoideum AX4]|eukprot:XP_638179.1 hypothetical protein DDB_G0285633 [Dictyostelium discoideum AX4]
MNKSIFFKIIIFFSLFSFSNCIITDYVFSIGHNLNSPVDIPRAAVPTFDNPLNENIGHLPSSVYNITLSTFYLNNIVSLSTNNQFGALFHYNNLNALFTKMNNITKVNLNKAYNDINAIGKFSTLNQITIIQIREYWLNAQSNYHILQNTITSLIISIQQTKNNLLVNSPNSNLYNIVLNNYEISINGLIQLNSTFQNIKTTLDITYSAFSLILQQNLEYNQSPFNEAYYITKLNEGLKELLKSFNSFYLQSFLLCRLI